MRARRVTTHIAPGYDPVGVLCDKAHDSCPMTVGDRFLYSYGDHVWDFANGRMAKEINALLSARRWEGALRTDGRQL
jgi:hypothetical protein